ncbi:TetR/AcrR family transcriptional regulator [Xylophilus sp.]|uniref:TetR/AcrR family transcriptional regulator n=1 Tax=Xylophilus sp. TaxID=2653893 RepID=UPI0013B982FF|nr:TetR/AcrR family transcriptional regulator [Xylophilus sp.]KAF1047904.1 MAG: HTH-type transcriptional repressor ComR [Xylophilus sp.]
MPRPTHATDVSVPARGRGRPREFDIDAALDRAIRVYCERGYHATSIDDLSDATALTSGSLYKAFGDKRGIFLAAFDRYKALGDAALHAALARGANGRERLRIAVAYYADGSHGAAGRRGCLVVNGAAELATLDAEAARRVTAALERRQALLGDLVREGQADGSIASTLDADTAARLLLCLLQGMRVVGRTGRSRREMQAVADAAMKLLD